MDRWWSDGTERGGVVWNGIFAVVALGTLLGVAQNVLVRQGDPKDGLAWRYEPPKLDTLESVTASAAGTSAPAVDPGNDPLGLASAGTDIPDVPRPIQVQIGKVRELFDAKAATFVDAREPAEYAEGHIPGAVNLPFDETVTDPVKLETFDAQGKPIIIYCGGGTCELSMNLGFALVEAGKKRVLVFMGGWPEWSSGGHPIAKGPTPDGA